MMIRDWKTFDKITTYPYGTHNLEVCESEMMMVRSLMLENYTDWPFCDEIILQKKWAFKETVLKRY